MDAESAVDQTDGSIDEWLSMEPLERIDGLPEFGFRLRLDHTFTEQCKPFTMPRLNQLTGLIGLACR